MQLILFSVNGLSVVNLFSLEIQSIPIRQIGSFEHIFIQTLLVITQTNI